MQFIHNLLPNWILPSYLEPPQSSASSPSTPSYATPDPIQRTEASGIRNAVVSGLEAAPFIFNNTSSQHSPSATHNYAKGFPPRPPQHQSFRKLFRKPVPRPGLGMPHSEHKPVKYPQSSKEERRLFPSSKERPDPKAVPIVPGQVPSKRKIQGITPPLKPVDKISRNARDSGPYRARGKEKHPRSNQPSSVSSQHRPNKVAQAPERSSKRRRVEEIETPRKTSISGNDSLDVRHLSVASSSAHLSPAQSQYIKNPKIEQPSSAFWEVEDIVSVPRAKKISPKKSSKHDRMSSEDWDANFTHNASHARRQSIISIPASDSTIRDRRVPKSSISVEVSNKKSAKGSLGSERPDTANGKVRISDIRESPDELQGEATVRPIPKSLGIESKPDIIFRSKQGLTSDIQPTIFEPASREGQIIPKSKRSKSNKKTQGPQLFETVFFLAGCQKRQPPEGETDELVVDTTTGQVKLTGGFSFPIRRVCAVKAGESPSRKILLKLSKMEDQLTNVCIELWPTPQSKEDFCSLMLKQGIKVQQKPGEWMDNAFKTSQRDQRHQEESNQSKRSFLESPAEETSETPSKTSKRVKVTDSLQDKPKKIVSPALGTVPEECADPSVTSAKPSAKSKPEDKIKSQPPRSPNNEGIEIPVKTYNSAPQSSIRSTRSMSRRTPVVCDDDKKSQALAPESDVNLPKWDRPLIYPRSGKKKAEVDAQDRERLRDHEFLNDNLIGFYMRFLEYHLERCNKEVAKRVYFFNSYFFATLTNLPRGRRGINYAGVQKWTRNVNLFSYDYIVVPINENAHWYVAIICNLPYLEGISNSSTGNDKPPAPGPPDEIPETPEPPEITELGEGNDEGKPNLIVDSTREERARHSLASMSLIDEPGNQRGNTKAACNADEEWPEREKSPSRLSKVDLQNPLLGNADNTRSPLKSRNGKKKSVGQKFDIHQPIIITFDSLDLGRSPTIKILREYLYEEAKAKQDVEISKASIKGMKACQIPWQPNYSDCGLYLLAYVEKFVQDPDLFVRKILQREMNLKNDWPPLQSGLLRRRLRKFLEELYTEQEELSSSKDSAEQAMVDQQPISYLLGPAAKPKDNKEHCEHGYQSEPSSSSRGASQVDSRPCKSPTRASGSPLIFNTNKEYSVKNATGQELVVDVEQLHRDPNQISTRAMQKHSTRHEVIQVPDSQEQGTKVPSPKATKLFKPHLSDGKFGAPSKQTQIQYVTDSDSDERSKSEKEDKFQVQIQVASTPSPRLS